MFTLATMRISLWAGCLTPANSQGSYCGIPNYLFILYANEVAHTWQCKHGNSNTLPEMNCWSEVKLAWYVGLGWNWHDMLIGGETGMICWSGVKLAWSVGLGWNWHDMLVWGETGMICWSGVKLAWYVDLGWNWHDMLVWGETGMICWSGVKLAWYVGLGWNWHDMLIGGETGMICWSGVKLTWAWGFPMWHSSHHDQQNGRCSESFGLRAHPLTAGRKGRKASAHGSHK